MKELAEPVWAVVSERDCEAAGLTYDEARRLEQRLKRDNIHGLCIVTTEAARRMNSKDEAGRRKAERVTAHLK
ncbi:MAG TPA: hypothetical protein VK619_16310 [Pyrinomonadaceae bacterium]|nr:hypothetical protein [Pyrinomonadaceae bacterium]